MIYRKEYKRGIFAKFIKASLIFIALAILVGMLFSVFYRNGLILDTIGIHIDNPFAKRITVPETYSPIDGNSNGTPDAIDIINAARKEVQQRTKYMSGYFSGGYPPKEEGVCTDVIWRGLMGAGINLKELMDKDIKENTKLYQRVEGKPQPNIDFRRVPNQHVFFQRFTESLSTEIIPGNIENLSQWQPGDILVFLEGRHHVAIVSDKRAKDGTPYIIHNSPPFAAEIKLKSIKAPVAGRYRWLY